MTAEIQPALKFGSNVVFSYGGIDVQFDDAKLINLTQMHQSAGSPPGKEPAIWRRRDDAASFIQDLASSLNVRQSHILTSMRGRGGATWAHWQIAVAYAKSLSNEYHRFVNEKFRDWCQEEANPDLKADRAIAGYRRHGMSNRQIIERIQGKLARFNLTDHLKEAQVKSGADYAMLTDKVNALVVGGTAAEIRRARKVPKSAPTRDYLSAAELTAIRLAEHMVADLIEVERPQGVVACMRICERAGEAVGSAMAQFRGGRSQQSA